MNPRAVRIMELALVLAVAFAGTVAVSLYSLSRGTLKVDPRFWGLWVLNGMVYELVALAVLAYVLFRQGRGFRDIGLTFAWKDLPRSLGLAVLGYLAYAACYVLVEYGHRMVAGRPPGGPTDPDVVLQMGVTVGTVIFVLINPFYEELIVRAYAMSELTSLTGNAMLAIAGSVLLQSVYHLYQGIVTALAVSAIFFVYALYYNRTKRITPIVLAHLYFDLLALLARGR